MHFPSTPSFRLDNKRALVTGAGKGIGLGASIALAEAGSEVVMVSRTKNDLEKIKKYICENGNRAYYKTLDINKTQDVQNFINQEEPFDILINNAGTNIPSSFLDTKERDLNYLISLNIKSVINITKSVVQKMLDKKIKGSIINVSSQMGHVGAVNRTTYCTTKFAIEGFTKSLSLELAPNGIRVNSICPTFIKTPMTESFFEDKNFEREILSKIPLKRLGEIEELMGPFVFLASDAASLITGASLIVDGGWTAQ
tara:strand:+ start:97 stop:861 length:765 start_codon:yes stop_codon:yes gene_type:complete